MNCIGVTWSFEEEGNTAFVQVNTIDIILKMKFRFTAMTAPTQHEKQLNRATSHNRHQNFRDHKYAISEFQKRSLSKRG